MNPPPENRIALRAFTLIELLTVITIIAILIGLLIPVTAMMINRARMAEAKAASAEIAAAVSSYFNDYAKYPVADYVTANPPVDLVLGDRSKAHAVDDNADLFNILRAINVGRNVDNTYNPKRVVYLQGRPAGNPSAPKSGFLDAPGTGVQGAFYDPWGKQYTIVMDANYNDVINVAGIYSDFVVPSQDGSDRGVKMGIGVFSLGKDGEVGSPRDGLTGMHRNGNKVSDDIVTWQ
jgi:prepilin-type N-terminal cleavage/methylation domain-containing protein